MNKACNHTNVIYNVRLRQSQQYNIGKNIYFTGIDRIIVEELSFQVHDVITKVKAKRNVQNISILISNHSGKRIKLCRYITLGHVKIMEPLKTINLTMTKLIEKEIIQIVEDNPVKCPTEFDMDPSPGENTKKTLSKLLADSTDRFATWDDDLKYPTTFMKMHTDIDDHKPIALKPYRTPLAHIKCLDEQIDKLLKAGIIRHFTIPSPSKRLDKN